MLKDSEISCKAKKLLARRLRIMNRISTQQVIQNSLAYLWSRLALPLTASSMLVLSGMFYAGGC